jgi:Glycosyl hydrolases family 15
MRIIKNNREVERLMRAAYTSADLAKLQRYLDEKNCFLFHSLRNGLYPAAASPSAADSGYRYVWVRDNVHIAHAHLVCGDANAAARTASALLEYFQAHQSRFRNAIRHGKPTDPMMRPHVRFDGETLHELRQKWGHAQNDALGYFLWLFCKLARQGIVDIDKPALRCVADFPRYFQAIRFWNDEDSGHWEEERKVSASSIGTVMAGLREFQILADEKSLWSNSAVTGEKPSLTPQKIKELLGKGRSALEQILPRESIKPKSLYRPYDGALLFLIYPLNVVNREQADKILARVRRHLQGNYGIRRYLGDSYWCPDYKEKVLPELRSIDSSDNMRARNAFARLGDEAQWCIFDSVISAIHGQRYRALKRAGADKKRAVQSLQLQTYHLNRALGQVTGKNSCVSEFRVPEAYYMQKGRYVPNDNTPLYWAQANLWLALDEMRRSLGD